MPWQAISPSVLQREIKHKQDSNKEKHGQGQYQRPIGYRRFRNLRLGSFGAANFRFAGDFGSGGGAIAGKDDGPAADAAASCAPALTTGRFTEMTSGVRTRSAERRRGDRNRLANPMIECVRRAFRHRSGCGRRKTILNCRNWKWRHRENRRCRYRNDGRCRSRHDGRCWSNVRRRFWYNERFLDRRRRRSRVVYRSRQSLRRPHRAGGSRRNVGAVEPVRESRAGRFISCHARGR